MSNPYKEYLSDLCSYMVWTSESSGDLFKADRILIYEKEIHFYRQKELVHKYVLHEFVQNNVELFEGITIKK